jgi:hypothetical protein
MRYYQKYYYAVSLGFNDSSLSCSYQEQVIYALRHGVFVKLTRFEVVIAIIKNRLYNHEILSSIR